MNFVRKHGYQMACVLAGVLLVGFLLCISVYAIGFSEIESGHWDIKISLDIAEKDHDINDWVYEREQYERLLRRLPEAQSVTYVSERYGEIQGRHDIQGGLVEYPVFRVTLKPEDKDKKETVFELLKHRNDSIVLIDPESGDKVIELYRGIRRRPSYLLFLSLAFIAGSVIVTCIAFKIHMKRKSTDLD